MKKIYSKRYQVGLIIRLSSFWIGLHYSEYNRRYCLNLIPGITLWWIKKGGNPLQNVL
jgi:hypothetical protein